VTFVVRNGSLAGDVVPVAWIDLDGDGAYGSDETVAPTEPFGLGGAATFAGPPAPEATDGIYTGWPVVSVDAAGDSFEMSFPLTFNYDSNDIYLVEDALSDMAGFEAALSETDVVDVTYYDTAAGTSTFNIVTDNTASATLKVTQPSKAVAIDSNNYTIKGTGDAGAAIRIYVDYGGPGETVLGTDTVAADKTWSVTVPLVQDAANVFTAYQKVSSTDISTLTVPTITEGAPAAATIDATYGFDDGFSPGELAPLDQIDIYFSETVAGVGAGDTVTIIDQDGSTAVLTLGDNVSYSLVDGPAGTDTILVLVVQNLIFATGGTATGIQPAAQIQAVSGFKGADGLDINVTGSGSGRVFAGF